jgi:hypothetical protein
MAESVYDLAIISVADDVVCRRSKLGLRLDLFIAGPLAENRSPIDPRIQRTPA